MRTNDFTGVYHMVDQLSPEAYKAQRLQELEDLAKWRARHMAEITSWSSEEKRLERLRRHELEEIESRVIANQKAKEDPNYIRSLMSAKEWKNETTALDFEKPVFEKLTDRVKVTEIKKAEEKPKTWWQKLWRKD